MFMSKEGLDVFKHHTHGLKRNHKIRVEIAFRMSNLLVLLKFPSQKYTWFEVWLPR